MRKKQYSKILPPILFLCLLAPPLILPASLISPANIRYREFKLMLKTENFAEIEKSSSAFLKDVSALLDEHLNARIILDFSKIKRRTTRYLDTKDQILYKNGFVCKEKARLGKDRANDDVKISLKYRSEHKGIADTRNVASRIVFAQMNEGSKKFEEEIDPRLITYNRSAGAKIPKAEYHMETLKDLADVFPILLKLDLDLDAKLETVNAFAPVETIIEGQLILGENQKTHTRLTFWHKEVGDDAFYMIEFSFSYPTRKLAEHPGMEQKTRKFFDLMKKSQWVDLEGKNKENIAYDFSMIDNHAMRPGK